MLTKRVTRADIFSRMTSRLPKSRFSTTPSRAAGSLLVVRQLLDQTDDGFLDELCRVDDADRLGGFAREFYDDRRSHVRQGLLNYIDVSMGQYRHEALVKRLFKFAESAGDDEAMSRFMIALDRSVRREVRTRRSWDWGDNEVIEESYLDKRDQSMPRSDKQASAKAFNRRAAERSAWQLFSTKTREYLRRRVWRYFRDLARTDSNRYRSAIGKAIVRYTDEDTADGLALIDNWSLTHVLFHQSDQLVAEARGWVLTDGGSLDRLTPSPYRPDIWKSDPESLLDWVTAARCRAVRMWSVRMLQTHSPEVLASLGLDRILQWIRSDDDEIASLAADSLAAESLVAESIDQTSGVASFGAAQWLEILDHANASVLASVCETVAGRSGLSDWKTVDLLALAMRRPEPVAALAIEPLSKRQVGSAAEAELWLGLADSLCERRRGELAKMAIEKVAADDAFDPLSLTVLIDGGDESVRSIGMGVLVVDVRTRTHVPLWHRVLESPHDDVQLAITDHLQSQSLAWTDRDWVSASVIDAATLSRLWATVLLNTRRGGKTKLRLIEQIGRLIERHPERVETLGPLLRTSMRSVRATEFRSALAAMVGLSERLPEIRDYLAREIPELTFPESVGRG